MPTPEVKTPQAYPEIARVISNEDPDGKGRIQVQTHWQEKAEGLSTSWVRVMTPNAGKSDYHSKNRGMVFISEVEEDKLVEVAKHLEIAASETNLLATNGNMIVHGTGVASFQGGSDVKVSKG